MKTHKLLPAFAIIFALFALLIAQPLFTAPTLAQGIPIYTPTAEANGNIYYIVKSGDTCQTISLINNISTDQLLSLNHITSVDDCDRLTVGRKLLIGIVPTQAITAGPSPTPTSSLPTPMPVKGQGTICVLLFNDTNGNAVAETGENSLANGEISIASQAGDYSKTAPSTGDNTPVCFNNINEGQYTISVAIPEGYNATTAQNYTVQLKAGDTSTIDFGAQPGSQMNPSSSNSGGTSLLLAVIGGLILIAGVGIGVYAYLTMQKK